MRIALSVIATLSLLLGGMWVLQGIDGLPGSFMTGQTKWAICGALLVSAALGLLAADELIGEIGAMAPNARRKASLG